MEGEKVAAIDGGDDGGRGGSKQELPGSKLRRGIPAGKKGGLSTPVPTWVLEPNKNKSVPLALGNSSTAAVSARKLGACLWEMQDLRPLSKMSRRAGRLRPDKNGDPLDLPDFSERASPIPVLFGVFLAILFWITMLLSSIPVFQLFFFILSVRNQKYLITRSI